MAFEIDGKLGPVHAWALARPGHQDTDVVADLFQQSEIRIGRRAEIRLRRRRDCIQ